jgi:hypothetical protein
LRLELERLEDRTLLSASIFGSVFNDIGGAGVFAPSDPGVPSQIVYLDLNHSGKVDNTVTSFAGSTAIGAAGAGILGAYGYVGASVPVSGLPATIANVAVALDVINGSNAPVELGLISPLGNQIPQLPAMIVLQPGQHFIGTIDGNAPNSVNAAPSPIPNGTYAPQMGFNNPQMYIENGNPNGTWSLVFGQQGGFGPAPPDGVTINSWSLAITSPEPSTQTAPDGSFSFSGLAPGTYQVSVAVPPGDVVTAPAGGVATQTVQVADSQTVSGVDFGMHPAADLTSVAFNLSAPATVWGQNITINYTLINQGSGAAPAFNVGLYLSSTGVINTNEPLLDTLQISGLAAGASASGSVTVALPATAPAGFGALSTTYVGFDIDPTSQLTETSKSNNSNEGAGIDLALVGAPVNNAVTNGQGVQQAPTIAVDPTNPNHLVTAYLDHSLSSTGYAGIGIAVSYNRGQTWTQSSVPMPADTQYDQGAAAPSVAFDAQGNLYVSFMAATFLGTRPALTAPGSTSDVLDGFQSNNGIFIAKSADGGLSWSKPAAVDQNSYTQTGGSVPFDVFPTLAVDTLPSSPYFGSVYVSWARYYPAGLPGNPSATAAGSDIQFAVSIDQGATWTIQQQTVGGALISAINDPNYGGVGLAPGHGYERYPTVTVGAGGAVYVSIYDAGYFGVFSSTNGGRSLNGASGPVSSFVAPSIFDNLGVPFDYIGYQAVPDATVDGIRNLPTREIAADPSQPGVLYAVADASFDRSATEGGIDVDANGIMFAVSHDYGRSWTSNFTVGNEPSPTASFSAIQYATYVGVLNDDNAGIPPEFASSLADQVVSQQALPNISVNAQGVITVVWYDTRTSPSGTSLQVWGTESTDGGQHFTANFPVGNAFDPTTGTFTAGDHATATDYLGDQLGLATAGNTAYAVWTTAGNGNQNVEFGSYSLTASPAAPPDRFYPNQTPQTATRLGTVSAEQVVPRLALLPGNTEEWFSVQGGATGILTIAVTPTSGNGNLQLTLTDSSGNPISTAVVSRITDSTGAVVGETLAAPSVAGQTYLIKVSGTSVRGIAYTLTAGDITGDFGTQVQGGKTDTVSAGAVNAYRLQTPVAGTLQVALAAGSDVQGALNVTIVAADGQTVLASDPSAGIGAGQNEVVSVPVTAGEVVFLQVSGANLTSSSGSFTLTFTNLDQQETSGASTLFLATQGNPSDVAVAYLQGPGQPADLLVSNTDTSNTLGVLVGNGNGTFQAERQTDIGPGLGGAFSTTAGRRQIVVANLTSSATPDVVVPNFQAANVSVLLGNGDATFQPQRQFDAVVDPVDVAQGQFITGSSNTDLVVLQSFNQGAVSAFAFLRGRGDGTFMPPVIYPTAFTSGASSMVVGDFTGNGMSDVVIFGLNQAIGQIFYGNGDGTFRNGGTFTLPETVNNAQAVDLGNGKLDLVLAGTNSGAVYVMLGNGDGTFQPATSYTAMTPPPGQTVGVNGLAVGNFQLSTAAGVPDIVVTAAPRGGQGGAELILLPGQVDSSGRFTGFGAPQVLAHLGVAGQIATGDFTGDGTTDIAVADKGGVTVYYSKPVTVAPNTTLQTARDLGNTAHLQTQPGAIVAGHQDAYYRYTVPTEAVSGAGSQVIDISAQFAFQSGAGLAMQVLDANGNPLPASQVLQSATDSTGMRVRVAAAQGTVLLIHVSGAHGTGVVTLNVDTLPQVVSVQAESPLPGGPTTSIVLTLQGDTLDLAAAQDPANYTITWAGRDGVPGTADDIVFQPQAANGGLPIVYSDSSSLTVVSGLNYPTAVRHTVTLLFSQPLPAGTYTITLAPAIQAAPLSTTEAGQLAGGTTFAGHPVVGSLGGALANGATIVAANLVAVRGAPGNLATLSHGTAFLTQYHDDSSALLDSYLAQLGDSPSITGLINQQIQAFFDSGVLGSHVPVAIFWFDPVSIDLADSQGARTVYDLTSNTVSNTSAKTYMDTGGSIEVIVLAGITGNVSLSVADVQAAARGGAVILDGGQAQSVAMTDAIRGGTRDFEFNIPNDTVTVAASEASGGTVASISVPLQIAFAAVVQTGLTGLTGAPQPGAAGQPAADAAVASGNASASAGVYDDARAPLASPLPFDQAVDGLIEATSQLPGFATPLPPPLIRAILRGVINQQPAAPRPQSALPAAPREVAMTPQSDPVVPSPIAPHPDTDDPPTLPPAQPAPQREAAPLPDEFDAAPPPTAVQATEPPEFRLSGILGLAVCAVGLYQTLHQERADREHGNRRSPGL